VWLADGNIKPRDDKKAQVFSLNKNVY
jgi:hypothetical protein